MNQHKRSAPASCADPADPANGPGEAGIVAIVLTDAQVAQVVRSTSGNSALTASLAGLSEPGSLRESVTRLREDRRYSRSFLSGLLVLGAFPEDGSERELTQVAAELTSPASTTHRYIGTWMAVGLLEQDPTSRRYRRALLKIDARTPP
jgi:hypothetical protein